MREKRELEAEMTSYLGITPAYAGKTIKCYRLYSLNRDHPRVCGKNCVWFIFMLDKPGSPPHMREKPCQNNKDADCTGITPACAGKTCKRMYSHHLEWDHPRVCGKNATASNHFCPIPGSPPRVREKPTVILTDDQALRITPACAGKTKALKSPLYYTQDHPRVCGKNHGFYFNGQKQMGSIPRLREKHNHSKGHFLRPRITLAYAGKTYLFLSYYLQS